MSQKKSEKLMGDRWAVTAIVFCHDRCEFAQDAVKSLLAQTRRPDQILLVNGASADDAAELPLPSAESIKQIDRVNFPDDQVTLGSIIATATGDFIWLFDIRDLVFTDALERHLTRLSGDPTLDFTYSDSYKTSDDDIRNDHAWQINRLADVSSEKILFEMLLNMNAFVEGMLIRRSTIESISLLSATLDRHHDLEFLIRLAAEYRGAKIEGAPTLIRRGHDHARGGVLTKLRHSDQPRGDSEYRKSVLRKIRASLPLEAYLRHIDNADVVNDSAGLEPASLVQRGGLLLHHGLVREGLEDVELALSHPAIDSVNRGWLASVFALSLDVEPWIFDSRCRLVLGLSSMLHHTGKLRSSRDLMRGFHWSFRRECRNHNVHQAASASAMMISLAICCSVYGMSERLLFSRANR